MRKKGRMSSGAFSSGVSRGNAGVGRGGGYSIGPELYTNADAGSITNEANAVPNWTVLSTSVVSSVATPTTNGSYAILVSSNATPNISARAYLDIHSVLSLVPGYKYRISFDARHEGSGGDYIIVLDDDADLGSTKIIATLTSADTTYVSYNDSFTHNSTTTKLFAVRPRGPITVGDGGAYVDNISIRKIR